MWNDALSVLMVWVHHRPGLLQQNRAVHHHPLSKKGCNELQQGLYLQHSSPIPVPCNAVTHPGFLNAALHSSDWGNSSWLCQSRKGGLYPVPGLEVALPDLEAMGRGVLG